MEEASKAFRRGAFSGGVISAGMGVVLLVWPHKTLLVVAALVGLLLVLLGAARLFDAVTATALSGAVRAQRGMAGLLLVILGFAVVRRLEGSLTVLTALFGIALVVGGLAQIAFGLTSGGRGSSRAGPLLLGVLELLAGVVLFLWPQTSLTVLVLAVGLWLIAFGVIQLLLALLTPRPQPA